MYKCEKYVLCELYLSLSKKFQVFRPQAGISEEHTGYLFKKKTKDQFESTTELFNLFNELLAMDSD